MTDKHTPTPIEKFLADAERDVDRAPLDRKAALATLSWLRARAAIAKAEGR